MSNKNKITCVCETCISAILLQYDWNKWRLKNLAQLDELYINAASNRLLQDLRNITLNKQDQIFTNNSHIHHRA